MTDRSTGHRKRVFAALAGERPDRVPVTFWGHNFARENSAANLADETVRLALKYDWDLVKVQSRYTCFSEPWGSTWTPSGQPTKSPIPGRAALETSADLDRMASTTPDYRPLAEQIDALRLIRKALGNDRPIVMTVFSPLMSLAYSFADNAERRPRAVAALNEDHARAARALEAVTELNARFARDCIDAGADGIFYASKLASRDICSVDDLRRFERPYDLRILESIADAPLNIIHVCGARTHFDEFADYPAACFSWDINDGNPDLATGAKKTGRPVLGGISAKPQLRTMTADQVRAEALAAIESTGGRGLLLAPGCSIDFDTPEANIAAGVAVARA
jgi:uroporphyrinogen decarboxylase